MVCSDLSIREIYNCYTEFLLHRDTQRISQSCSKFYFNHLEKNSLSWV